MKDAIKPLLSPGPNVADVPNAQTMAAESLRQVSQPKRMLYRYLAQKFKTGDLMPGGRVVRVPKTHI